LFRGVDLPELGDDAVGHAERDRVDQVVLPQDERGELRALHF
jgi:hypothetical protein